MVMCSEDVTKEEIAAIVLQCDDDGNGEIDFGEFAGMMAANHRASKEFREEEKEFSLKESGV